jgi:hypothetical protein
VDSWLEETGIKFNWAIERKDSNMDLEVDPTTAKQIQGEQSRTVLFGAQAFFVSKSPMMRSHLFLA